MRNLKGHVETTSPVGLVLACFAIVDISHISIYIIYMIWFLYIHIFYVCVHAGNWTLGLMQEQVLLTAEPSLQTLSCFLKDLKKKKPDVVV